MASSNDGGGGSGNGGNRSGSGGSDNNNDGGGRSNSNSSEDSSTSRWWRAIWEGRPNSWGQYLRWRQAEYEEERKQEEINDRFNELMRPPRRDNEELRGIHDTYNDMAKHLGDTGAQALAWLTTLGYFFVEKKHLETYVEKVRERQGTARTQIGKLHECVKGG